jgi:site-specific recombinase XerC
VGRAPRNKGLRYPPDPPAVEEIVAVMRAAGDSPEGVRLRAIIVVLWRAGLRISEALALNETDLVDSGIPRPSIRRATSCIAHPPAGR